MMNLLVTGAYKYTQEQLAALEDIGFSVHLQSDERSPCQEASKYDAVVCNALFMHSDIEKFSSLRFIQLTSAGLDRVPLEAIRARGIRLANARGIYSIPIAEWTLLKILEIYKKTRYFEDAQRRSTWAKHGDILELYGKTAGIVGVGSIGQEIARRLEAFSVNTIGFDIRQPECSYLTEYRPVSELDANIGRCDIVIIALPLTDDTYHLMSSEIFERMKDNAVLVNVARGAIVDEAELIKCLDHKLRGAALDVFEDEPLAHDSPLWRCEKAIITPHNSFVSDNVHTRMFDLIRENLSRYAHGIPPLNLVSP